MKASGWELRNSCPTTGWQRDLPARGLELQARTYKQGLNDRTSAELLDHVNGAHFARRLCRSETEDVAIR